MQLKGIISIAAATSVCAAGIAHAGMRMSYPVAIDTAINRATGYFSAAYNTSNRVEYIGCSMSASAGLEYGWCSATDAAGVNRSCYTMVPEILGVIRSLETNSSIAFTWDDDGLCTAITTSQYSFADPKVWGVSTR